MTEPEEVCARCKQPTEGDGRTLWMSCFYNMAELNVPFKEEPMFHVHDISTLTFTKSPASITLSSGQKINLTAGEMTCSGTLSGRLFHTLRVCKSCRADWLSAIETWFNTYKPSPEVGSGIFTRRNGASVEITEEEWHEMRAKQDKEHD